MNILPKKSWHVRNKDNIAKVHRDEENVRLEEEKLAKRAALAEQEARTKLLRDRVHNSLPAHDQSHDQSHDHGQSSSILPYGEAQTTHVNLFEQEESGSASIKTTNKEYEAEKKAEKEKQEKALGVLKYLGQSLTDKAETPWYLKKETKGTTNMSKTKSKLEVDKKKRLDPLHKMNTLLADTKKSGDKKKKTKKTEEPKIPKNGKKTIEQLRYERLKREKEESFRAQKLIRDSKKGTSSKTTDEEEDPYSNTRGRYHSQYNPDLARKPKWNRHQPY